MAKKLKKSDKVLNQVDIPVGTPEQIAEINSMHKYFGVIIDHKMDPWLKDIDRTIIMTVLKKMIDEKTKISYNDKEGIYVIIEGYTVPNRVKKFKKPIMIQVKCSQLLKIDESKMVTSFIARIVKEKIVELSKDISEVNVAGVKVSVNKE